VTKDAGQAVQAMLEQASEQLKAGSFETAIEAFSACLLVSPQESAAFRGRATARFQLKDWKHAAADFKCAYELDPSEPESGLGLGLTLAMQNEVYPAIAVYETLLQKHPNYVRAYIQLGVLHFKLAAIAKGRDYLQEALKHHPTLEERRYIEAALINQDKLDRNRYYRPDFEALRKRKSEDA